jgi:hypothetical protein
LIDAKASGLRNLSLIKYKKKVTDKDVVSLVKFCGSITERIEVQGLWQLTNKTTEAISKNCPNLKTLILAEDWDISDSSLIKISEKCSNLSEINLSNLRKISDESILCILDSCDNLTHICLNYCKTLTDNVLDHEAWKHIKEASFQRCTQLSDKGFDIWTFNIEASNMWIESYDSVLSKASEDLASAKTSDDLTSDGEFEGLASHPVSLGESISFRNLNYDDLASAESFSPLQPLSFHQTTDFIASFKPQLSESDAPFLTIEEDDDYASTSHKYKLSKSCIFQMTNLNLRDCSFLSDSAVASIACVCGNLRVLNLSFCCSLTPEFARHLIKGCRQLAFLDVSFCGGAIEDETLLHLSTGLRKLIGLSIRGCIQVTDLGIEHLLDNARNLELANVTQCRNISKEMIERLKIQIQLLETESVCEWRTI